MADEKPGFRYIVRVVDTDLDGNKKIVDALRKIKGVGFAIATATCHTADVDRSNKTGELSDDQIEKLNTTLRKNTSKFPKWLLNRRSDPESGEDVHLLSSNVGFVKEMDIRRMKKVKSYRGMRHAFGVPVRGQRTKSNFRRNKGKGLGVSKSAQAKKK